MSFDEAHRRVQQLCDHFDARRDEIMSSEYKEATARAEFVTPFFEALGWDVNNAAHRTIYEKDCVLEKAEAHGGTQRSADYAFRRPGTHLTAFFVEAKRPSVDIRHHDECYQAVLYGWNASTPLVILTDFEQFLILDARSRPDKRNAASHILRENGSYTYRDYRDAEKFTEIWGLFSRQAVADGSIDKAAAALPRLSGGVRRDELFARGTRAVDDVFLAQMERWRETLAKSLKRTNQDLSGEELTSITQRILDRLIFLRFLEDRLIERDVTFDQIGRSGSAWRDFERVSDRLDARYNGIIYKHDRVGVDNPSLYVDDAAFAGVVEHLEPRNSDYKFATIPLTILGSIYERFLGNVIVATDKTARVEPKPEVRKAHGVYYTPDYIVRYIVDQTVGRCVTKKTPKQIEEMRFADIACGSGGFLEEVFSTLIRYHLRWYIDNGAAKWEKRGLLRRRETDGDYVLTLSEKRRILLNNIYGIDIDPQAVEVTQLSLYLRLLEDESFPSTQLLFDMEHHALLPDLRDNIICGNSLIETDIADLFGLTPEELEKTRPLDIKYAFKNIRGREQGGMFDAIVGNPPYDVVEKDRGKASWPHDLLLRYVRDADRLQDALGGKLNLYRFFVVRGIDLVVNGGWLGMIVPLSLLGDISCARPRRRLLSSLAQLHAACFPQKDVPSRRVFRDAKLSTMTFTGRKPAATIPSEQRKIALDIYPWNVFTDAPRQLTIALSEVEILDPVNLPIPLASEDQWKLCQKIHRARGVRRLGQISDFNVTRGEINQTIYRAYISQNSRHARLLKGVEIAPYRIRTKLSQGEREWLDEKAYLKEFPARSTTNERRIATQRITGVDERLRVVATIIEPPAYFADSTNSITLCNGSDYALEYLLGLLNSKLTQWRFKLTSSNNNVGTNELDSLPIRTIRLSQPGDRSVHDHMVKLVKKMLATKRAEDAAEGARREHWTRQCEALDRQIDQLVYELYGLTDKEIALIKET